MTGRGLVARHPEEWRAATHHPFLDGVRDGSLPEAAFRTWLVQDYLFVFDLLRFQGRLVSVAPRAGQRVLGRGLVALEGELGWFESQAARLRLQLDLERHPVTEAYRRRLLSYAEDWARGSPPSGPASAPTSSRGAGLRRARRPTGSSSSTGRIPTSIRTSASWNGWSTPRARMKRRS